jgi:hypothetical protein
VKLFLSLILFISSAVMALETDINKYSINLMWINKTCNTEQKYISNAKDEETVKEKLLEPVFKWALANPSAEINLWYDSVHTTDNQVKNTESLIKFTNIRLRDVREIPIVKNNQDAFSDFTAVYYRVDMLKVIIVIHSIEHDSNDAAIFSDLEVGDLRPKKDRMTKEELFNDSTMKKLDKYGLLINTCKYNYCNVENQFLQLINNKLMISSMKNAIVNANLLRAETALNCKDEFKQKHLVSKLEQPLFPNTYVDVFQYYLQAKSGELKYKPWFITKQGYKDDLVDYDPKQHGYLPLGNVYNSRTKITQIWCNDITESRFKVLPLKALPEEFHNDEECSRNVDVRNGHCHDSTWEELIKREPANGKNYTVTYW